MEIVKRTPGDAPLDNRDCWRLKLPAHELMHHIRRGQLVREVRQFIQQTDFGEQWNGDRDQIALVLTMRLFDLVTAAVEHRSDDNDAAAIISLPLGGDISAYWVGELK